MPNMVVLLLGSKMSPYCPPCDVKASVVQKHLTRTGQVVLNGVHQAIREIYHYFHDISPWADEYAVVLQIGKRHGRPFRGAQDWQIACPGAERASPERHGREYIVDRRYEVRCRWENQSRHCRRS